MIRTRKHYFINVLNVSLYLFINFLNRKKYLQTFTFKVENILKNFCKILMYIFTFSKVSVRIYSRVSNLKNNYNKYK